jgi:alpha-1,6-mannosyltransferase
VVRGWKRVRRATGARLVLVGDGPAARRLRTIPGADEVVWIPYQSDREQVANIIAALDLYIAPGPMETFGLSAAEALASGTPLLSVNHGAVPELVAKTGAGALYPRGDAAGLADAAIALLGRDDLRALGIAGRTSCELHYSWDAAFDRIFSLYRALR